ncbi:hypothetical protein SARC_11700 [Sphaeroforma arctica JP610]|uniref:Uncharacterized protein n=1 Tax=Sphaeroforma arctica JP610 TaxID=667725 RepID=A0A0L0FG92_9EUKA|nr:hypothetical protein SARC_11700 [Sphaeroforma arctica JP610]KNC75780.1 hypothetical protein SARC_11700 [Sphaeroforma arctica JP610]|eukprot:XP_014149682.1 hypothetical protein SARC_11700 [Sphaeroforma arctica JP610]
MAGAPPSGGVQQIPELEMRLKEIMRPLVEKMNYLEDCIKKVRPTEENNKVSSVEEILKRLTQIEHTNKLLVAQNKALLLENEKLRNTSPTTPSINIPLSIATPRTTVNDAHPTKPSPLLPKPPHQTPPTTYKDMLNQTRNPSSREAQAHLFQPSKPPSIWDCQEDWDLTALYFSCNTHALDDGTLPTNKHLSKWLRNFHLLKYVPILHTSYLYKDRSAVELVVPTRFATKTNKRS